MHEAVKETVEMLEKKFSDNLVSVTAFGNFAKGEKFDEIDLLVVVEKLGKEPGVRQRLAQTIGESVFLPVCSKYRILFNVLVYGMEELKDPSPKLPLWNEIAKYGIVLSGRKVIG